MRLLLVALLLVPMAGCAARSAAAPDWRFSCFPLDAPAPRVDEARVRGEAPGLASTLDGCAFAGEGRAEGADGQRADALLGATRDFAWGDHRVHAIRF